MNQRPVVTRMTMKAMMDRQPSKDFIRVHRSFILPLGKIDSVRNRKISIAGKEIPLGGSYEQDFHKYFKQ